MCVCIGRLVDKAGDSVGKNYLKIFWQRPSSLIYDGMRTAVFPFQSQTRERKRVKADWKSKRKTRFFLSLFLWKKNEDSILIFVFFLQQITRHTTTTPLWPVKKEEEEEEKSILRGVSWSRRRRRKTIYDVQGVGKQNLNIYCIPRVKWKIMRYESKGWRRTWML